MIAPIDAGIVITIRRFNAITGYVNNGNLFSAIKTSDTTKAAIKYAITIRIKKTGILYLIFAWNTLSYAKKLKNTTDKTKTRNRLINGSVSPNFHASSENETGTAKANAPITTWLASYKLKLRFIFIRLTFELS